VCDPLFDGFPVALQKRMREDEQIPLAYEPEGPFKF
jgi:hypothetical protein